MIVTVAQAEHGLDDGDVVTFDDMRDSMSGLNGKAVKVKRVAISSPVSMIVDPAFRVQLFGVPIALDSMYYVVF